MRSALLFCGVALTWTCAAFGLLVAQFEFGSHGCPSRVKIASLRVREIDTAIAQYQIDAAPVSERRSTIWSRASTSTRVGWSTRGMRTFQFKCTDDDDTRVVSAGPDGIFGTADDITNER